MPSYVPVDDTGIVVPSFIPNLKYQWLLYNTLAKTFVTELPVTYGTYGWKLNAPGGGEVHMPTRTANLTNALYEIMNISNFEEYSLSVIVMRNNTPVWEGFLGRMRSNSLDSRVSFALIGLWDFFRNRYVRPTFVRTATDLMTIVTDLVTHCQTSQPSSDLSFTTSSAASGIIQDFTINDYDFKYYGDAIEDLARSQERFDFRCDTAIDAAGAITRVFTATYPQIGTRRSVVVEYGKNMESYQWNRDGSSRATRTWGIGSGEASAASLALSEDTSTFGRVPLRETLLTRKDLDLSQQDQLQSIVDGERRKNNTPIETISCVIVSENNSEEFVGAFNIGDSIMCTIDDGFTQIDGWYRVLAMDVTVSPDMQETISLDLGPEWATGA